MGERGGGLGAGGQGGGLEAGHVYTLTQVRDLGERRQGGASGRGPLGRGWLWAFWGWALGGGEHGQLQGYGSEGCWFGEGSCKYLFRSHLPCVVQT
jgi:hypothetical protein